MVKISPYWTSLERRSATLFIIAGGLLVGHAAIRGIRAFTDIPTPMDGFGPAGFLLGFLGLLGFYPALSERSPWLARVGALLAIVPILDYALILAWGFAEMAGVVPHLFELLPGAIFFPIHQSAMVLTYGLFGVATLRVGSLPQKVGILLVIPSFLILGLVVDVPFIQDSAAAGFLAGSAIALIHFVIGYSLGPGRTLRDSDAPTGEQTTG